MKTWTILICAYNCANTIKNTLDSIVYEGNDDIDVFVVDDGSPENLESIVKPYVDAHPNIVHYFKKENGNQGSCINFAIQHANSRYLSLLDSDDTFNKRNFNKVLRSLRTIKKNTDLVILNYKMMFVNRKNRHISKCVVSTTNKDVEYKTFDKMSLFRIITIHSSIYSLKLLKKCGKIPEKMSYADNVLYYEVLLRVNNIAYLNKDIFLYNYFIRGRKQAIYLKTSINKFDDILKIYHWMLSIPLKEFDESRVRAAKKIIGNHMYWMILILGNSYIHTKEEKAKIVREIYTRLEKFEKANKVKIEPTMMKLWHQYKYGGAFLAKFLYKFVSINFIKAIKLNKTDKKELVKLTNENIKFEAKAKIMSRLHEKMLKKYKEDKKKEKLRQKQTLARHKRKLARLKQIQRKKELTLKKKKSSNKAKQKKARK